MITDEERREIAAKLREVNPYRNQSYTVPYNRYTPASEYLSELAGALGYSPENDVSRLEFQSRLADLIEPSCDRDALLTEVKELEKCAWYFGLDFDEDEPLRDRLKEASEDFAGCARRIREALGVSDD